MRKALLLIAVAGIQTACATVSRLPPPPAEPPVFDLLIIPGKRVGPVSLEMTQNQLFAAMGRPTLDETIVSYDKVWGYQYQIQRLDRGAFWVGLEVQVGRRSERVTWINVGRGNNGYRTKEGVRVGTSQREVVEFLGRPVKVEPRAAHSFLNYCYPGLRLDFLDNVVIGIGVSSLGC